MDGFTWIIFSWVVVGILSYLFVTRFNLTPAPQTGRLAHNSTAVESHPGRSEWINEFIVWLASHHNFPIGLSQHWLNALNDVAKKICVPAENEVLFERVQPVVSSSCPKLSEAYAEVPSVNIRMVASENADNYVTVNNYQTTITNLSGDVST
ncbi:C2 domain-containing protein [Aphelenchoides fujianensis]|nr:C2 domain-containing protein [Aphelenchoides fujianensis]